MVFGENFEYQVDNEQADVEATVASTKKDLNFLKTSVENQANTTDPVVPSDLPGKQLTINKKISGYENSNIGKELVNDNIEQYIIPILSIRGMGSNKSDIPLENRGNIIKAIDSLGEFEKIKIKGCTDGSQINSKEEKDFNKIKFEEVKEKYTKIGGNCPSYDELLQSKKDPQNTILGYRRAMEGILSLNLSPEQMKKIEISNVLGQYEDNPQERGFDVEADYTKKVEHFVDGETTEVVYDFLGKLEFKNFSGNWQRNSDVDKNLLKSYGSKDDGGVTFMYGLVNLDFKTHLNPEKPSELYMRVVRNLPQALVSDPETQEKIMNQIKDYLKSLISICGGTYNNGVWSAKSLTLKQYCIIKAVSDKLISNQEFSYIINGKNTSFLEEKELESGKKLKDFVSENKVKGVGYAGVGEGKQYRYYSDNVPVQERYIAPKDYVLLSLYFQTKNS